jgi:ubiquinone biosynthesis protein
MDEPRRLSRAIEIGRMLFKYRNAGIFSVTLDNPLLEGMQQENIPEGRPEEFVDDLEALGPTFIKIGQGLSTRPDFVPQPYVEALERMQDDVAPVPFAQIREVVESELGVRISKMFATFEETPLAAASLAQVHAATLRDGRKVAVKVQRPDIAAGIRDDLDLLASLAGKVDRFSDMGRRVGFADWVGEFRKTLIAELDYRAEADNLETFARNLADYPKLFVPKYLPDFSAARVLTMEMIGGQKVTKISDLRRLEEPLGEVGRELMRAYLDQIFVHGLIQADPHPGNFILTADNRLALLDLGMVAHVPPRMRDRFLKLMLATVDGRGEEAAESAIALGTRLEDFDEPGFVRDTSQMIAQYASPASPRSTSSGCLLLHITTRSITAGLRPPPELSLLGKTLLNLEAVSNALDPDLDHRQVIRSHLETVLRQRMMKSLSPANLASEFIEVQELLRESPKRISQFLHTLAENKLRVHVVGLEESRLMENLQKIANRISTGVIVAALIMGGAMMMRVPSNTMIFGYPALALLMFLVGAALGVTLVVQAMLADRRAKPSEQHGPN